MKLLTEYALPALLVAGFIVYDHRTRHMRPFVLKQALFVTFFAACFCASLHLHRDLRVAVTMFLFIFVITSLAALGRWAEQRRHHAATRSHTPLLKQPS
ncbi:MAG: hypothetical protein U0941_14520 [Planctomycetaceae bacterium]